MPTWTTSNARNVTSTKLCFNKAFIGRPTIKGLSSTWLSSNVFHVLVRSVSVQTLPASICYTPHTARSLLSIRVRYNLHKFRQIIIIYKLSELRPTRLVLRPPAARVPPVIIIWFPSPCVYWIFIPAPIDRSLIRATHRHAISGAAIPGAIWLGLLVTPI